MAIYFETKAVYDKMQKDGEVRKTSETFIVDAQTFAEAEERTISNIIPHTGGEVTVKAAKRTSITEIYNPDAEKFFLAKVAFIVLDENTGKEKKNVSQMLIGAEDIDRAKSNLEVMMQGTMSDWQLQSLSETAIVEVFRA